MKCHNDRPNNQNKTIQKHETRIEPSPYGLPLDVRKHVLFCAGCLDWQRQRGSADLARPRGHKEQANNHLPLFGPGLPRVLGAGH